MTIIVDYYITVWHCIDAASTASRPVSGFKLVPPTLNLLLKGIHLDIVKIPTFTGNAGNDLAVLVSHHPLTIIFVAKKFFVLYRLTGDGVSLDLVIGEVRTKRDFRDPLDLIVTQEDVSTKRSISVLDLDSRANRSENVSLEATKADPHEILEKKIMNEMVSSILRYPVANPFHAEKIVVDILNLSPTSTICSRYGDITEESVFADGFSKGELLSVDLVQKPRVIVTLKGSRESKTFIPSSSGSLLRIPSKRGLTAEKVAPVAILRQS
ncbi:hypothetical protein PV08_10008 [Exophiala spinifera]|uniref:Uncharacterized protein n=1 Tax=Exophiala spinifera TaxID=91928 RepID=A0A0D2B288_9EURO|nr:uncharacterized protein PV08_10008 [Exophiala spinifera]KIW12730.1 hypothetical protein PV08_10008 [Exophiala spinifera]